MAAALLIFPNQLYSPEAYNNIISQAAPQKAFLLEEPIYFYDPSYRPIRPNKVKIAFMKAAMGAWYDRQNLSIPIEWKYYMTIVAAPSTKAYDFLAKYNEIHLFDPLDHTLMRKLRKLLPASAKLVLHDPPNFALTSQNLATYNAQYNHPRHATFYEFSKATLNHLNGTKSQDTLNRQPPPKNPDNSRAAEKYLTPQTKKYYDEGMAFANSAIFKDHVGDPSSVILYPITPEHAKKSFAAFLATRFAKYGPYQDAIVENNPFMYHSVISASLNIGILTPQYVIQEAITKAKTLNIPFNSLEGFVRQVIGWREYMRYIYVYYAPEISQANLPANNRTFRKLAPWYKGTTGIYPLDQEIKKAVKYAYAHHIIRLMVFMNFFILCELHPAVIYKWFMEVVSIDAYDWVMVGNIYAMGYFDKGAMRKPYITTSNYILKMSNYKDKNIALSWTCLWDSLFYRFVANKSPAYVAFYKRLLKRFTTEQLNAHKQRAQYFIDTYTQPIKK